MEETAQSSSQDLVITESVLRKPVVVVPMSRGRVINPRIKGLILQNQKYLEGGPIEVENKSDLP